MEKPASSAGCDLNVESRRPSNALRFLAAFAAATLFFGIACAAGQATDFQPLTTSVQMVSASVTPPTYLAHANAGTNRFSFVIPQGFALGGDPAHGKLMINNLQLGAFITFSVVSPGEISGQPTLSEGKVVEEFDWPVLHQNCHIKGTEWKSSTGLLQITRTLRVPSAAGLVEIRFTSNAKNFGKALPGFNSLLNSLKCNEDEDPVFFHPPKYD